MLAAGLDGIKNKLTLCDPVNSNIYKMDEEQLEQLNIRSLPASLKEAIDALEQNEVIKAALGEHITTHFIEAKRIEWDEFRINVHPWERERYITLY